MTAKNGELKSIILSRNPINLNSFSQNLASEESTDKQILTALRRLWFPLSVCLPGDTLQSPGASPELTDTVDMWRRPELGHGQGTCDQSSYHLLDFPPFQTLCLSQQDLGLVLIHDLFVNGS